MEHGQRPIVNFTPRASGCLRGATTSLTTSILVNVFTLDPYVQIHIMVIHNFAKLNDLQKGYDQD